MLHYPLSQAGRRLEALVRELDGQPAITLTRRGRPVAVLVSAREYRRLTQPRPNFWEAYQAFLKQVDLQALNLTPMAGDDPRDPGPGRDVPF